jgi:trk system potassium uptake protein TrkA
VNVIVVGCGRVGAQLAANLSARKHDVTVIDFVGSQFRHLDPQYRGRTIEAEAMAEGVLEGAGIRDAHALAAVTNSDAVNSVIGYLARVHFRVPSVVVRNYDPRWRPLHESMGLTLVSTTAWGAQRMEELLENPVLRPVYSAGHGEIEVYEVAVPPAWNDKHVGELTQGIVCTVVALTEGGRASTPTADTTMRAGDVLHIGASLAAADALRARLTPGD